MNIHTIGVDLGKTMFHVVGMDERGKIVIRKRMSRMQLLSFAVNLPICTIAMEASCGAHNLGRILTGHRHQVRLIPAQFVRPFVKSNKNDYVDAEAIAEAVQRPTMRFVPIKTEDQLDLQALHRVRDRFVSRRTGVINQLRAFLLERGITLRQGRNYLHNQIPAILADAERMLSPRMYRVVLQLWQEWQDLEQQIKEVSREIESIADEDTACKRLLGVPGIGALTATAMVASIGNGSAFSKGRDFAAWLGLVPRQHSTGGKTKLLGISKRGNEYLRRLFIHGARSVIMHANRQKHSAGHWVSQLETRVHRNVLAVALANKLARIAWAVLAKEKAFCRTPELLAG